MTPEAAASGSSANEAAKPATANTEAKPAEGKTGEQKPAEQPGA